MHSGNLVDHTDKEPALTSLSPISLSLSIPSWAIPCWILIIRDSRDGLELKVFLFESFLHLKFSLAFLPHALLFHISLNTSVHSLSHIEPLAN